MKILVLNPNTSEAKLGVPAGLGLTTSKVGALAEGPPNPRSRWPISTALGLTP
jgi:hypothetical protein